MRTINMIVIHCSATPKGAPATVESMRRYHVNTLGWKDIGYHYVIYIDGSVHNGRPIEQAGAHAAGYNTHSIGICYVGGVDRNGNCKDTRTEEQKKTLINLIKELKAKFPTIDRVLGHYQLPNVKKCCPCFDAKKEYENL